MHVERLNCHALTLHVCVGFGKSLGDLSSKYQTDESINYLMWDETGSSHVLLVGLEAQVMKSPGGQIHIQARRVHLVPIALEHIVVEYICQLPCSSSQVVPGQMNTCLRLVL